MRGAVSKGGSNASLAGEGKGMEKPKRARKRKPDTAKVNLEPSLRHSGGQGVHREVESEGYEEKYRAVIKGLPRDEPVGQRWGKVESAL
jgi:hypothetical protein